MVGFGDGVDDRSQRADAVEVVVGRLVDVDGDAAVALAAARDAARRVDVDVGDAAGVLGRADCGCGPEGEQVVGSPPLWGAQRVARPMRVSSLTPWAAATEANRVAPKVVEECILGDELCRLVERVDGRNVSSSEPNETNVWMEVKDK